MKAHVRYGPQNRDAFTAIEMVVVIAIIIVIMGLLLPAVQRVRWMQEDAHNRFEIDRLEVALRDFERRYNILPPSRILISNDKNAYTGSQFGIDSWKVLTTIWKKLDIDRIPDWSNGSMTGTYAVPLEGQECLVFFLGGIQSRRPNGCLGFAANEHDPTILFLADGTPTKRWKSSFVFDNERLFQNNRQHTFFSYKDAYFGKPYAYFRSSGGDMGQYNPSDCVSLSVTPYKKPITSNSTQVEYIRPKSFQIISAGRDTQFGPGGAFDPTLAVVPLLAKDDMTNFHDYKMGTPK